MSTAVAVLQRILQYAPTVLKFIAALLTMLGGTQTTQMATGAFGATPGNIWTNVLTYGGAAASWIIAAVLPHSLPTIEKWLAAIVAYTQKRMNIDPKNETDVDEKFFDALGAFIPKVLELWLKKIGTPAEDIDSIVSEVKARQAIAQSGMTPQAMQAALKLVVPTKPSMGA